MICHFQARHFQARHFLARHLAGVGEIIPVVFVDGIQDIWRATFRATSWEQDRGISWPVAARATAWQQDRAISWPVPVRETSWPQE